MQHDIVVFTGPTLSPETARQHLDALYLPPADQGAIAYVVSEVKPAVIVLIDGVFGHVPAIRHKEILWALSKNVCMCGAASMGAIRAAELHSEGMQGYGLIYRWYRATPLADDDEVAVAMSPVEMGSRPIGEALINIRLTLRLAVRQGVISEALSQQLQGAAKSTYFMDRSYSKIVEDTRPLLSTAGREMLLSLERWLPANAVDQKKNDAVGLLDLVASGAHTSWAPRQRQISITQSWFEDLKISGLDTSVILKDINVRESR